MGIDDRKGVGCSFDYSTPLSEWTHLAFVADTATVTLYVNGVPQSATCASMPLPMGAISARGNDSLRAYLDELKIWDETLSREQVERLAVSEAVSLPGPLTGFTVVDASDQTVVGRLAEGATLTLDDPASGSYGIRVDTESGAQIGSVRLELSGRKTVSRTENIKPYSLHGDGGDGALHGEPLPAGSYTLRATAYEEQDLGGDVLGTLEVSFTVAAANTPATGAPTIGGTAQVGETLTADTSGIADEDGLDDVSFSYQWVRNDGHTDADIAGETNSSYTLDADDEGKAIKVKVSFTDDAGNAETLTSAATATVGPRPNTPATGLPVISGTAQVGETLTVDTSGIADGDGLDNANFSYQWLADDVEINGADGSSYTLVAADEDKAIKVRVSFTDDERNAEARTSAPPSAVAPPLTAQFLDTPPSHDGQTAFTFELRFSEEFDLSYVTLRDHAFTVTGGEVTGARRLDRPGNIRWEITVKPGSNDQVTVALPVTEDCAAEGAVCTEDGRMLSNRTELTVSGPGG